MNFEYSENMQPKKWPGDFGKTKIMGTHEMDKDAPTFEAIGAVDELNSFIGLVINRTSDGQDRKSVV